MRTGALRTTCLLSVTRSDTQWDPELKRLMWLQRGAFLRPILKLDLFCAHLVPGLLLHIWCNYKLCMFMTPSHDLLCKRRTGAKCSRTGVARGLGWEVVLCWSSGSLLCSWLEVCSAQAAQSKWDGIWNHMVYCQAWHHLQSIQPAPLNPFKSNVLPGWTDSLAAEWRRPTGNDLPTFKRTNLMADKRTNILFINLHLSHPISHIW